MHLSLGHASSGECRLVLPQACWAAAALSKALIAVHLISDGPAVAALHFEGSLAFWGSSLPHSLQFIACKEIGVGTKLLPVLL